MSDTRVKKFDKLLGEQVVSFSTMQSCTCTNPDAILPVQLSPRSH